MKPITPSQSNEVSGGAWRPPEQPPNIDLLPPVESPVIMPIDIHPTPPEPQ